MQGVIDPTQQGGPEIGPPNADCHLQCALRRPVSISFGSRRIACAGQLTHVKASLALYCPLIMMEAETTAGIAVLRGAAEAQAEAQETQLVFVGIEAAWY